MVCFSKIHLKTILVQNLGYMCPVGSVTYIQVFSSHFAGTRLCCYFTSMHGLVYAPHLLKTQKEFYLETASLDYISV